MTKIEEKLLQIALPKWPALLVKGTTVTKDEAAEICVRTDSLYLSCNDHEWEVIVYDLLGIAAKQDRGFPEPDWKQLAKVRKQLRCLAIHHLTNRRIASAWIGGPHGWMDWDGKVGKVHYNLGKYPNACEVYQDAVKIAKAFPFLCVTMQLCNGEVGEETCRPVVQFHLCRGKVQVETEELKERLPVRDLDEQEMALRFAHSLFGERGCTVEQLKRGMELAKRK